MYFEEQTVRDLPQLKPDHDYHWLEKDIKSAESGLGLNKKDIHDAEHEKQLIHWGCKPTHSSKLSIRQDDDGVFFSDRLYHIMLHLRYWKETNAEGPRKEAWQKFEEQSNFNLDNLTLPSPSSQGEDIY